MNNIREKTLLKPILISVQKNGTITNRIQIRRIMVGRKIHKNSLFRFQRQFNSWNHITIGRNNNRHITFLLIGIRDDLGGNTDIRFLFLVCANLISTIPTSTDIIIEPKIIDSEIIFRQISYLKINSAMNKINFNIIAFSFNILEKNSYINIPINLIYSNATKEGENASCILNNDSNGARNNLYPLVFYCELNNINDIGQVNDIEIIPSPLIKNIPIDNSNLVKASITDYLIKQGIILDYIKEENLNKIPLLFYDSSINAEKCDNDGTFEIISFTYTPIEKNITFNLKLNNPNITARCKIPISIGNEYITIKCSTMNSFAFTQIKINSKIAYDMEYNELFYINNTESNNYITCQNNDKIKLEEAKIKVNTINIFRQASKFKKKENKYNFFYQHS